MNTALLDLLDEYPDTTIVFGENCMEQLASLLDELKAKKIVAFTGNKSVEKNGAWRDLLNATGHSDTSATRFSEIEAEPCIETVEKMITFLETEKPDEVIALGGGSVMDAAKAAYLVYQAGGKLNDYFGVAQYSQKHPGKNIKKVICFPTTSGTGSEATPYSNIVDNALGVKKLIVDECIIPAYSFINPAYAASMDRKTTLATACDALAHSIEGFLNTAKDQAHPLANTWALESIKMIVENLPRILENPNDMKAREALAAAACMGGMVIRYKPTGLPHLCSFSWFGRIPHGLAVAILVPYAWKYYLAENSVRERTFSLHGVFAPSPKNAEDIIKAYCKFLTSVSVPISLKQIKTLNKELLDKTAKTATACENRMKLTTAPRPVPVEKSYEVLSAILNDAWDGNC